MSSKTNLKNKFLNAVLWSALDTFSSRLLKFIIGIILARILEPEQFGLIAMLLIFIEIANAITAAGFQSALINHKNIDDTDKSSVFYLNLLLSTILAGILFISSPYIAILFGYDILSSILQLLCFVPVIGALSLVQAAIFHREMQISVLSIANLIATSLSGAICIYMATSGFGVWSLVAQQLSLHLFYALYLWHKSPFVPKLIFSRSSLIKLFPYSSNFFLADIINKLFENIYYVVIGRLYSATALAFYSRADSLAKFSSLSLTYIITKATFPAFSIIQDQPDRITKATRKVITYTAIIVFPIMTFLIYVSENIILLLLTEKWIESVPFFILLCFSAAIYPIYKVNIGILIGTGKAKKNLHIEVLSKLLIVIVLGLTFPYGIKTIIYGQIFCGICSFFISAAISEKITNISIFDQLKIMLPYVLFCFILFTLFTTLSPFELVNNWKSIFVNAVTFFTGYIALIFIFCRKIFLETLEILLVFFSLKKFKYEQP